MTRIGDILTRYQSRVSVKDDMTYKQVTIRTNYRGVVLRGHKAGIEIGTKNQWSVKPGQFILSRIDARQGAFGIVPEELDGAIVTNDFMAYDLNEKAVDRGFFNIFLQSPVFLNACIKASRGNTNRKRVQEDFFLDYEVNLPPLTEQKRLIRRINLAQAQLDVADAELDRQRILADKLKQAILQAAIRGELTAGPRKAGAFADDEPAEQLLERIDAEKARLLKEKKLRKQKPLPPLTEKEIPFALPDGWAWCHLRELCEKTGSGSTPTGGKSAYVVEGVPFLRSQNVHDDGVVLDQVAFIPKRIHKRMEKTTVFPNDLLLNITGGSIGRCALVRDEVVEANVNQHVAIIRLVERWMNEYIHSVILSPFFQGKILDAQTGAGREGLPKNKMDVIPIPLPPLAEQSAIVARVEALLSLCRSLEAEVAAAADHAAALRRGVLQQAFAPPQPEAAATPGNVAASPMPNRKSISITEQQPGLLPEVVPRVIPGGTDLFGQPDLRAACEQTARRFACYVVRFMGNVKTFGRVKLEKINHLAEYHAGVMLGRTPVRRPFGPYDEKQLTAIEKWAGREGVFTTEDPGDGGRVKYKPGGKLDEYANAFVAEAEEMRAEVDRILRLLKNERGDFCEHVATAYAAWNDLLIDGYDPTDTKIITDIQKNWHRRKGDIPRPTWARAIKWLRENGIEPKGTGRRVEPMAA